MALLAGAAAIVAIVLLSSGGNDDESGTADTVATGPGSTQTTGTSGTRSGSEGIPTTGSEGEQRSGESRTRSRTRRRSRRGPRRQRQGRLGPQTGSSPAQGGSPGRPTDQVKLATINLSGGSAVGGVQRVRFEKGKRAAADRVLGHRRGRARSRITGSRGECEPAVARVSTSRASKKGLFEIAARARADPHRGLGGRIARLLRTDRDLLDHDGRDRPLVGPGWNLLDRVHDVHAFLDLAEQGIFGRQR